MMPIEVQEIRLIGRPPIFTTEILQWFVDCFEAGTMVYPRPAIPYTTARALQNHLRRLKMDSHFTDEARSVMEDNVRVMKEAKDPRLPFPCMFYEKCGWGKEIWIHLMEGPCGLFWLFDCSAGENAECCPHCGGLKHAA